MIIIFIHLLQIKLFCINLFIFGIFALIIKRIRVIGFFPFTTILIRITHSSFIHCLNLAFMRLLNSYYIILMHHIIDFSI